MYIHRYLSHVAKWFNISWPNFSDVLHSGKSIEVAMFANNYHTVASYASTQKMS